MKETLSYSDLIDLPTRLLQGDPFLPYWGMLHETAAVLGVVAGLVLAFLCLGVGAKQMLVAVAAGTLLLISGKAVLSASPSQEWIEANGVDAARVHHVITGRAVEPGELTRTDIAKSLEWLESERREMDAAKRRLESTGLSAAEVEIALHELMSVRRRYR